MQPRHGGRKAQEHEFCAGLTAKEIVAAGKGLSSSGWTCTSPACGAKGNFPNRCRCRGCGKATAPAGWTTAQQRAAALKLSISKGTAPPWSSKGDKDKAEASESKQLKELQEVRKQLAQVQKELKEARSPDTDKSEQPKKEEAADDDHANDVLAKQVTYLQCMYEQSQAAQDRVGCHDQDQQ